MNIVTKLQQNIDKMYHILNYIRIKPRSRPPQKKKSAYFTHPDFSGAKLEKKSEQITRANTVLLLLLLLTSSLVTGLLLLLSLRNTISQSGIKVTGKSVVAENAPYV
jgi:hypothetical protein